MAADDKLLWRILGGRSDANVGFEDLCGLLSALGFAQRVRGSHHIFRHPDIEERVNLQRAGRQAKPYQVRQVRAILVRYRMGDRSDA